jgi:hypothetical protein
MILVTGASGFVGRVVCRPGSRWYSRRRRACVTIGDVSFSRSYVTAPGTALLIDRDRSSSSALADSLPGSA